VKHGVPIAVLVISVGAASACHQRPLPLGEGIGGAGADGPGRRNGGTAGGGTGGTGGVVVVDECRNPDIDIPSATLAGALTIAGAPADLDPFARILLRNGLNDLVEIPFTGPSYSVRLAPGRYDAFFSARGPSAGAPDNQLALLRAALVVAPGDTTTLDIDVPVTTVAGIVTVNGAPLAGADGVGLSLRNAAGDVIPIATDGSGSYSARVVPGTFDLYFSADPVADGGAMPGNQRARLARNVVVGAGAATKLDIDIPSAIITGAVVIDGVPAGTADAATMILRNADGDVVRVGLTNGATYAARIVPGSYDLYVAGAFASLANQNARLRTGVVVPIAGAVLNVDVPATPLEGTIRIDGALPDEEDSSHLLLRNAAGDQAALPWTSGGTYSVRVVPGTYDLFYSQGTRSLSPIPANQLAKLRAGVVVAAAGTTVLDIDVRSTTVRGAVTINGAPANEGNIGILQLRSADGDRVTIASTASSTFSVRVVPGTYDVFYARTAAPANTSTPAPANHAAKLKAGVVIAPGDATVLDIDIPSTMVSGAVTINGMPAGEADVATLLLQSAAGDYAPFPLASSGSYVARLVPGTYDLYFSRADGAGIATPMNTLYKLRCFTVP
jgi:hypothetical protein